MTEEETRALAYQAQQRRRRASEQARLRSLAGSPSEARQVREAWQPIRDLRTEDFRREHQEAG